MFLHTGYIFPLQCETALRATVYFLQRVPHTLASGTNLLPERGIPAIAFSGEYTGISLEVLV